MRRSKENSFLFIRLLEQHRHGKETALLLDVKDAVMVIHDATHRAESDTTAFVLGGEVESVGSFFCFTRKGVDNFAHSVYLSARWSDCMSLQ